ncbi:radical SAM protein [Methylobacterium sp. NMS14P]|uniref:radical SAM protein n=1 Tax=Methylobacterium sp. NMS14P TaxID=2894310 RepID=UPI0023595D9B|nr:radical SAM protein [Methylobacterium sp. NMS14P]WCS26425.1 radical SAM protein [Methylobacterium sp. NMS14P]
MFKQAALRKLAGLARRFPPNSRLAPRQDVVGDVAPATPADLPATLAPTAVIASEPPALDQSPEGAAGLWLLHTKGPYLLARGGDRVPPPITANIALTNKCNLRCEICGSQKSLDLTGSRRRHSDLDRLKSVADTLFPFLVTVELNSQGDPLLYPNFEDVLKLIKKHDCEIKVQTNGTLFKDSIIDLLVDMYGEVNISLDAVGPKFDAVRKGGIWAKAEPGMRAFLARRDPEKLQVGLYPTVTKRTVGEAVSIVEWSRDVGIDTIVFHRYNPLPDGMSIEEPPTQDEYDTARAAVHAWCVENNSPLNVHFEGERLNPDPVPSRRSKFASAVKQSFRRYYIPPSYPVDPGLPGADPVYVCDAPNSYVEIGLDAQVSACCRSQDIALGYATSVEAFADSWFGHNYARIRHSLTRDYDGQYPLPNCESCVKFFAPNSSCGRTAVPYEGSSTVHPDGLSLAIDGDIVLDQIVPFEDKVYRAAGITPGIDIRAFDLVEADAPLTRVESLEAVKRGPSGCYFFTGRTVFFTTTDGKDARFSFSRRRYALRSKAVSDRGPGHDAPADRERPIVDQGTDRVAAL